MKSVSLILLPGLDGTGTLFNPLLRHLPSWINPVVISYPKDQPLGYRDLLKIVTDSLPENGDFVLLGESFSGPLSVMAAAKRPERLVGLILCATFVKKPFRLLPSWISHLSVSPIYMLWPATIQFRALFYKKELRDLVQPAAEAVKSVKPRVISARVKVIFNVNVEQDLLKVNVPILYMKSCRDHLIKKHNAEGIKRLKREMKIIELDTQHFILQLEPRKSAEVITQFIQML